MCIRNKQEKKSYVYMLHIFYEYVTFNSKGRPGMSNVSPLSGISGLSFDSTLLSSFLFLFFLEGGGGAQ